MTFRIQYSHDHRKPTRTDHLQMHEALTPAYSHGVKKYLKS